MTFANLSLAIRHFICYFCVKVMEKGSFSFKQFTIRQDRCAMKVGTDGVLLGAWADCPPGVDVLDIGCGTGLITLMMSQRFPHAHLDGVELDWEATIQAKENVKNSPFAARVNVMNCDVRELKGQWGCIVCNPPFYSDATHSPDASRALARSIQNLTFEQLWSCVNRLLLPEGLFNVIIPFKEYLNFHQHAIALGYSLVSCTQVRTTVQKSPKRVLLCYRRGLSNLPALCDEIVLTDSCGNRSIQLQELTKEFYLR